MKRDKIIIGSRGSKLALIYAEKVHFELQKEFTGKIEIKKIVTSGDENQKDRLSNLGGKGLFSNKIEDPNISKFNQPQSLPLPSHFSTIYND